MPLDRDCHRALALPAAPSYSFAATSHLLPAVANEFAAACHTHLVSLRAIERMPD